MDEDYYTEHLSDYSEDFEDDDSSKAAAGAPKPPQIDTTPKRQVADSTPQSLSRTRATRTDPVQRKARSHYVPSVNKVKNWKLGAGKGRAFSEKQLGKGTPFSPRDRELSAKLHSIKRLQNRLTECQRELVDMKKENKLLTRMQVRQERELTRVQKQEGELPQILARHSEEVRVLREQLKRSNESSLARQEKVSTLHSEIQRLKNRSKKLEQVAKQKNLLERESLTLQLQEANDKIKAKDRKIKDQEKGMETLHKTHAQEVKSLMLKNKALAQEAEAAKERADRILTQLKERTREMDVMNIYSQRVGRSTLNSSLRQHTDIPLTENAYSQTDLSCAPDKNVSMQTKPALKSSSSQTQASPRKPMQTRTTQTDIQLNQSPVKAAKSPSPTPQQPAPKPPPVHQAPLSPPKPETTQDTEQDEEQQRKNLLLSRLRALDGQKGPPASQPIPSVSHKSSTDVTGASQPPEPVSHKTSTGVSTSSKHPAPSVGHPTVQEEEAKRKKLLLAKLMAIDDGSDPKNVTLSKLNTTEPASTADNHSTKSSHSNTSLQSLPDTVDNMHKGKPAFFTEDDPFGSRSGSGRRHSGLLKSNSTKQTHNHPSPIASTQTNKPTFGRRVRDTTMGPAKTIFNGGLESDSKAKDTSLLDSNFSSRQTGGKKDYPWEKRVNLDSRHGPLQGPGNQSMVFGPMTGNTRGPLLPLRPKADANRVDVMPGNVVEPDDLEELVL